MMADLPDTWTPYVPIVTSLVRALLNSLGGAGFTWALAVNDNHVQMVVSAAMVLTAAGWAAWQKVKAQRVINAAAHAPSTSVPPALPP